MTAANSQPEAAPRREGSLAERPLARLLIELYGSRFGGQLFLRRGRTEKRLRFHRGAPVSLSSSLERDSLLALLERRELLTAEEHAALAQRAGAEPLPAVLASGKVAARALLSAVRAQVRAGLAECFGWLDGEYRLEPESDGNAGLGALRSDPYTLVRDGIASQWSTERMLGELAPRADLFAIPQGEFEAIFERLCEGSESEALFEALRRCEPLARVLGRAAGRPRELASLWVLEAGHVIELRSERPGDAEAEQDPFAAELEIQIEHAAASDGATTAAESPVPGPRSPAMAADLDPATEKLAREIERLHESLDELDHYQLLGVGQDADAGALRKAYFKAAKRFHPDALARRGLASLRGKAGEVFARIAEANDVLGDPSRRKEYDARLGSGSAGLDTAQLAQAESFFRKGEILVRMGDFRAAVEFLERAVELWPDECAYRSALGWSLHKKSPPENDRALEHLQRALELEPEDSETHLRMGTLQRALGNERKAAEHLALAKG